MNCPVGVVSDQAKRISALLVVIFLATLSSLNGQSAPRAELLLSLSERDNLSIAFNSQWPELKESIDYQLSPAGWEENLTAILRGSGLRFENKNQSIRILRLKLEKMTVSGFLEDGTTGERLVAGTVFAPESGRGTLTNGYGFFSLELPSDTTILQFSYLGYQSQQQAISPEQREGLRVRLEPAADLPEIVVVAADQAEPAPASDAARRFNGQQLLGRRGPGGEADLFDLVYQNSGSQRGVDGLGGLFVRGGGADQNLVLLDDTPIFQPSHAFGLFSVVNPDIVRSVSFYQDGFPARFGGRLSSVMDVRSSEGNTQRATASAEVSTMATKLRFELPTVKDKGAILLAARRTHLDPFLHAYSRRQKENDGEEGRTSYHFYDLNLKAHHTLSDRDRLYFSAYRGGDIFNNETFLFIPYEDANGEEAQYDEEAFQNLLWGNTIASLRWNRLVNDQLFVNTTLTYSNYQYESYNITDTRESSPTDTLDYFYFGQFTSVIRDLRLKVDADYYRGDHHLTFGLSALARTFIPGAVVDLFEEDSITGKEVVSLAEEFMEFPSFGAGEFALYAEDAFQLNGAWSLSAGLRLVAFVHEGQFRFSPEPRLGLGWRPNPRFSGRLSVSRMQQFLHLLTSSGASLPTDLWVPATNNFGPQSAWQFSLSGSWEFEKRWKLSTNAYYKRMEGLLAYDSEVSLPGLTENPALFWEDEVVSGRGKSYGFNFSFERRGKKTGLSGGYFYQRSERQFEELNEGQAYPFDFDRPHKLNLNLEHRISPAIDLLLHGEYGSGRPITLVRTDGYFDPLDNFPVFDEEQLSDLNDYRLPAYHRVDLSLRFHWSKPGRTQELRVGLSNLYNQRNVFYEYEASGFNDGLRPELRQQRSLPLLPMFSYRVAFSGTSASSAGAAAAGAGGG